MKNLERYNKDLSNLIKLGHEMQLDLTFRALETQGKELDKSQQEVKKKVSGAFESKYQKWYTEAFALIRQLLPDRLGEFETLYKADSKRKSVDATSYKIQDWLMGLRAIPNEYTRKKSFDDFAAVNNCFTVQLEILKSLESRFESSLFDIRQLVQADLFDSEIDVARELLKNGFLRAAGVVSSVVLEFHLSQVCTNHRIAPKKKDPSISDFNDQLKSSSVIDVPQWRFIQRLGDLRNLCSHKKHREPTSEEVAELIDGTEKITKTLY
jgi:hypothetical protein